MILKCIANKGAGVGPLAPGSLISEGTRLNNLTVGRQYTVYGMVVFLNGLNVLIADDFDRPAWVPLVLFSVDDPRVPDGWEFAFFPTKRGGDTGRLGVQALWGYTELVRSEAHLTRLADMEPDAQAVFAAERRRREASSPS